MAERREGAMERELQSGDFQRQASHFRDWVGERPDGADGAQRFAVVPVGPGYDWNAPHGRGG